MRDLLKNIYVNTYDYLEKEVIIKGWVRNHRPQKEFGFLMINDGSYFETAQVVYSNELSNFLEVTKFRVGVCLSVKGIVKSMPNGKEGFEIQASEVTMLGDSLENFPIQPKRHSREFLREVAHLRTRTNLFTAVFRVRSLLAHAVHSFFNEKGFIYVNTPLITATDGEGTGQMFQVTTLDLENMPKDENNNIDYKRDFFAKKANLTVTGQLEAECYAMSFGNVYTFGPAFRAENSNTQRHVSEFWMIEPEMAFADINDNMDIMEELLKYTIDYTLRHAKTEMKFFDEFVQKGLLDRLNLVLKSNFERITHKEAIDILLNANVKFENKPTHGGDLSTEHEKYLTETHFKVPVFVTNWPKEIKAFYMKINDDNKTVAAVDLLVPGSGELCGGSERETNIDVLESRMKDFGIDKEHLEWYLDLRRYGGCVHSGFGMGFERLIMYITGIENIRDVIPFPRTPRNCEF